MTFNTHILFDRIQNHRLFFSNQSLLYSIGVLTICPWKYSVSKCPLEVIPSAAWTDGRNGKQRNDNKKVIAWWKWHYPQELIWWRVSRVAPFNYLGHWWTFQRENARCYNPNKGPKVAVNSARNRILGESVWTLSWHWCLVGQLGWKNWNCDPCQDWALGTG